MTNRKCSERRIVKWREFAGVEYPIYEQPEEPKSVFIPFCFSANSKGTCDGKADHARTTLPVVDKRCENCPLRGL